jgi:nicotinamide riboside kinase
MLRIIITGSESSGKTTLCKSLSSHFNISFSKEYAREYLQKIDRNYTQEDLIIIAKGQLKSEKNCTLLDTDLITIKIWSHYKYGSCDKWILEQIEKQKANKRLYLLCKPDIAWEEDPLRENPENRMDIFKLYREEIKRLNHDLYIVEGNNRTENSVSRIIAHNSFI